jgi:S-(hydroxymethyl)glutathione dehydrogenase/alcohol dehydrogenase
MRTRAAVMFAPGRLELRELEVADPRPGEVVVRMSAVGVCGTDLHSYNGEWDRPTPIVLGHEGAGVVEATGAGVEGVREGDRVVLSWAPACGECGACRRGRPAACGPLSAAIARGTLLDGSTGLSLDGEAVFRGTATGALADRVVVAQGAAMPVGDDVPLDQAALLGCAALTGVGAVLNAARPDPGFTALVVGAGGVGQFVVQGARIAGAAEILAVDPVDARREQALALGATRACAPDDVREVVRELDPEGVDYAFDAVGAPATTKLALRWTRGGGTTVVVGLPAAGQLLELDPFEFSSREKTLTGTIYGSEDPALALPRLLELVRSGELELSGLVGPSFPLERADAAFRASLAGEPGRVLVTPAA